MTQNLKLTGQRVSSAPCTALLAVFMLCAVLLGCGPGTGGTGVGPTAVASPSTLVGNYSGSAAPSSITPVPGAPQPGLGGLPVAALSYTLILQPQSIRITGACIAFSFDGAWTDIQGAVTVQGTVKQATPGTDLALAVGSPSTLSIKPQGTGLRVTLTNPGGLVLLTFDTATRLADGVSATASPACSSLSVF